jgi:hypothetical protein
MFPQFYSSEFIVNETRIVTGSASAVRFATGTSCLARFKALSGNIGSFLIGATSATCQFELDAGDDTGWISLSGLQELWHRNPSGTVDYLSVWIQR